MVAAPHGLSPLEEFQSADWPYALASQPDARARSKALGASAVALGLAQRRGEARAAAVVLGVGSALPREAAWEGSSRARAKGAARMANRIKSFETSG